MVEMTDSLFIRRERDHHHHLFACQSHSFQLGFTQKGSETSDCIHNKNYPTYLLENKKTLILKRKKRGQAEIAVGGCVRVSLSSLLAVQVKHIQDYMGDRG